MFKRSFVILNDISNAESMKGYQNTMSHILNHEEISSIEKTLSTDQTDFLSRYIQNNVYDTMLGKLIDSGKIRKLQDVDDEDLYGLTDEYILIERCVAADGETFQCDEGHKNLKYLYVIQNVEDGKIIKLGGTCLKNLTGLSGDVVNALIKCFDGIDREYERILLAFKNGEWENQKDYTNIEDLPAVMKRQLGLGLPLSDLQQSKVQKQIKYYFAEQERKEQERKRQIVIEEQKKKVLGEMNEGQRMYYDHCSGEDKDFIVEQFHTRVVEARRADLDKLRLIPDIEERIKLGLPLNFFQESIYAAKYEELERIETKAKIKIQQQRIQSTQEYLTYNEILEKFEGILGELKSKKDAAKSKCPGTYGRIVTMIRDARDGKKVKRIELLLELQGISNAMGWGYELY